MINFDDNEPITIKNEDLEDYMIDNIVKFKNNDNLAKCNIDIDLFQKGINSVSEMCGIISALVNIGINPHKALDYIVDKNSTELMINNNTEIAKINAEASVKSSKYELANLQKNTI